MSWNEVETSLNWAKAIAWDTCHKIYVLMDDRQVELMIEYGYDPIVYAKDTTQGDLLDTLKEWFDDSCGLRFITAVETKENPNDGFTDLIHQGEFDQFD